MKSNTHPKYYPDAKVTCSCGEQFTTGSTVSEIQVDICSKCHPFFTGEMKFVDTQGRVEKFEQMRQKAEKLQTKLGKKSKKALQADASDNQPQTLKEMMTAIKDNQPKPQNKQTNKDSKK